MPVKNEEFVPLTPEEKEALIARHLNYISDFNRFLPDGQKLVYNAQEFGAALDDPEEVGQYRKGIARMERLRKQESIYENMTKKFGAPPEGRHYLNRVFGYSFKTEDTPEARKYNEQIYLEYRDNPEKVLYQRIQRLLNFDPKPFLDTLGDERRLIDFYDENQALVEDAFAFSSILRNGDAQWMTPALRGAIDCLKKPIEALNESQKRAFAAAGKDEYLTLPKLTPEQALAIMAGNSQYMIMDNEHTAIRNYLLNVVAESEGVEKIPEFYRKMLAAGWRADKNFFVSRVAEETDPQTGAVHEVTLDAAFARRPNVTVRERTADEIFHIRNINRDFEREYAQLFRNHFSDLYGRPFDLQAIEREHRGGFWERFLHKTSPEYKNFLKTLKEYNDPNSKNYLCREKLRESGLAYRRHKLNDRHYNERIDPVGRGRMELVDVTLATLDDMERNDARIRQDIEANLYEIEPPRAGEPFLQREEVEPNVSATERAIEIDHEPDLSIDSELNNSMR